MITVVMALLASFFIYIWSLFIVDLTICYVILDLSNFSCHIYNAFSSSLCNLYISCWCLLIYAQLSF